ncbi:hypothetical protein EIB18_13715 [Caulobacter vibrioides]|uniref:Uncharacterized protein n=1 Tax=Caulobacter vibrioides (strain NA1000 / CB15N) TaxID=565050 RepID=A0A0H3J1Q9_CAUVN|nr:hypothetical protein [Caulobacter vibrioides]YP_009020544.1 hypothetical protein CCNA_03972 [Caulobacter vibrioides NA1000]AHI88575.1 hypothetical protein CCNA_03972 [Caulobacter vibrioides NA1000]AVG21557.1 hypothetical protein CA608_20355 [Caulobacter vibrioides]AVH77092.1 hypothetical protein CA607_20495 [Caulobacter vibrioides]AZH13666.1 hypothetical protein EIB18_13715 [Caulobacter vibrioides]PLR14538.1 hypothetical protein CVUC_05015 [Caulobacter vibrioides]
MEAPMISKTEDRFVLPVSLTVGLHVLHHPGFCRRRHA